jgi:thioredoxin 1
MKPRSGKSATSNVVYPLLIYVLIVYPITLKRHMQKRIIIEPITKPPTATTRYLDRIINNGVCMKRLLLFFPLILLIACSERQSSRSAAELQTTAAVNAAIQNSGDSLVIMDFYADWCGPCHSLDPILEQLAANNNGKFKMYRINVDQAPDVARSFGVKGIPFVVFMKGGKTVDALTGLQPAQRYQKTIDKFAIRSGL